MNGEYVLSVPSLPILDELQMEEAGKYMELHAPKFGINNVNWKQDYPYHPITVFSIAHTEKFLYVNYFVRCNYLRAVNYENNKNVCEDSCVEIFLQVPGSDEYWNFEFNCIGAVNASHRKERKKPFRLTDAEIARIKRYASCGTNPFQELEGLFNWSLVIAIPLELMGINETQSQVELMGNLYKCASATSMPHYVSWAPITTGTPDFHRPEFFGRIILE